MADSFVIKDAQTLQNAIVAGFWPLQVGAVYDYQIDMSNGEDSYSFTLSVSSDGLQYDGGPGVKSWAAWNAGISQELANGNGLTFSLLKPAAVKQPPAPAAVAAPPVVPPAADAPKPAVSPAGPPPSAPADAKPKTKNSNLFTGIPIDLALLALAAGAYFFFKKKK